MPINHPRNQDVLINGLFYLRNRGSLCDLVIQTKEKKEILAHKVVLASWSPGLKAQFEEEFATCQQSLKTVICYNELDYDSLLSVINFMYGQQLEVSERSIVQFLAVAKVLDVPPLKEIWEDFGCKLQQKDTNQQLISVLGNLNNESRVNADKNPKGIQKLPVITEIFFGERLSKDSNTNSPFCDLNSSVPRTENVAIPETSRNRGTENEVRLDNATSSACSEKVSTCQSIDISNVTSEESENSRNIDSNNYSSPSKGACESVDSDNLEIVENSSSVTSDTLAIIDTQNDGQTKEGENSRNPNKCKRGRPRKLKSEETADTDAPAHPKSLLKSDRSNSELCTRNLRKRNHAINNSCKERGVLKADHAIPVKKRKLQEIRTKSVQVTRSNLTEQQCAERNSDNKHRTFSKNHVKEISDSHLNKSPDDMTQISSEVDDNIDECNYDEKGNVSVSDDTDSDNSGSKKNKKKRLRIYEKQATMYDLSFKRYDPEFVELYELLRCHRCCAEFKDRAELYLHIDDCDVRTAVPDLPIYCPQCDIDFSTNNELMAHRDEYHSGRRPGGVKKPASSNHGTQRCHLCDVSYKTYKMLEQHLLKTHNYYDPNRSKHRLLRCKKEGCKFMVIRVEAMYAHYNRHSSTNKFRVQCPLCNVSYLRVKWLEGHMKKEHSTEDGRIPPVVHSVNKDQERTRRREREMTSEKTRSNKIVNVKNKTDKKNFTFECKHCSYKCRKKIGLQKHMLGVHREVCPEELIVRLLRCPHDGCSVEFVEHSALKNHMTLVHGHRSKLHVCGDCGAEFLTASSLSGHMRQHKEKTITCPHNGCNYKTHTNLHLKTHIKHKHMGEEGRDHLCHLCGYRCHSRGNLKLHLLNRHHMDLRFKRIRKKGQQVVNALENGETLPTQRETKTSGSHEKNGADGTIGYDAQSAVQDEDLTNKNQQTDITSVVATMSTPVLSVTQSQLSQVESQSDIYLHTHAVLQGDLAGDLQVEGHIQTDVNNLGSDLEHSTCSTAGVKAHLSVPQNDFYHQESVIKTNISLSNDRTLEHRANDPPTHVNTSQYDVRNQNYPSYMTSPNTWHYQGDYNAHYLHPSASFTPSTIHPEEYAQLMNHSQEHIGHSRNLDLMTNQTDTYLPPIEEHHYSPNSGWKFK